MTLIRRTTHVGEHDDPVIPWMFGPEAYPEFFGPLFRSLYGDGGLRVEEYMDGDKLVVRAELPDIDPDKDVELTVSDSTLHIHVERHIDKRLPRKDLFRSELRYSSFSKDLPLPAGVDERDIKATCKAGILEVRIPVDEAKASATKIPVSAG
jgi:HSP20 family protein